MAENTQNEIEYISIELGATSKGVFLDIFEHTDELWFPVIQYYQPWKEMGLERPEEITDNTGTLWSETYDVDKLNYE